MTAIPLKTAVRRGPPAAFIAYPAKVNVNNTAANIIEIGPGRGDFLFHLAKTLPDAFVTGIEIKPNRVDKLIKRVESFELPNIRIIQGDAREALPHFFETGTVDEIYILFSDPWPKRKHEKHRVISDEMLNKCATTLKTQGTLTITTDHQEYAEAIAKKVAKINEFKSLYPTSIVYDAPDAFPTFFAQKWILMGRKIAYQKYVKI